MLTDFGLAVASSSGDRLHQDCPAVVFADLLGLVLGELTFFMRSHYHATQLDITIQREFLWDTGCIEKVFEWLMPDFTIGLFLFWKVDRALPSQWTVYEFAPDYDKENPHNDEATRDADFRGHHLIPTLTDLGFDEFEALCEARRALKGRLAVVMAS